jgi:DNA repair exonuclease SbcCD ATPase subunit
MNVGSRSDEETSQVGPYDFDRLERSVEFLIQEHERLTGEREELVSELVDREHRIAKLESQLETEQRKRLIAVEGVDKILNRLEQLRASVTANASNASNAPNASTVSSTSRNSVEVGA